jgi:NAD(P)H-hydrate epimerase
MQTTNPEAMVLTGTCTNEIGVIESDISKYSAIGAGPGIGTGDIATSFIENILANARQQLVLDADALNVLSEHPFVLKKLPAYTILTPHPGEFKRLAGTWSNDVEKIEKQLAFSKEYNAVVVLKGAHTSVSTPDGRVYFNSTGNPGMAKGGSGDVLTGIITALAGQGYEPATAAITGVYIHGLAGDFAAEKVGLTGMTARDIIHYLPSAFALFDGGVA